MAEMHFNALGATHTLRLREHALNYVDDRTLMDFEEHLTVTSVVWEGMVDASDYFFFEAPENAEIWELFGLAILAYRGYRSETETERRGPTGE